MKDIFTRYRPHLVELEDLSWFPDIIRSGGTDFLRHFLIKWDLYEPTIPILHNALVRSGRTHIIDLCSGGGGYIEQVYEKLNQLADDPVTIQLTDKFPNLPAFQLIKERTKAGIDFVEDPVDIFAVPPALKGCRVLYSAIHHFKPLQVKAILADAVQKEQPIGIFDGFEYKPLAIIGLLILHPILFLIYTPFFKPFKWSRLLFTYLIPLIPLYTIWDGIVSVIRFYHHRDLAYIADSLDAPNYKWEHGQTKNRYGMKASYLVGYPVK